MAAPRPLRRLVDLLVTLALWVWFVGGFPLFAVPAWLIGLACGRPRAAAQRAYHLFFRTFFALALALAPGLRRRIDPAIREVRGAVVVCNHLSYLDPLLLVSLFPRHATFVKPVFGRVPVFSFAMRMAGYVPAGGGRLDERLLRRLERLRRHLAAGGVLFVFPEGHRGRNGALGPFRPGAFRLARRFGVPLELLYLEHTDRLFEPGRSLLHTGVPNTIVVERLGRMDPPPGDDAAPLAEWMAEVRARYEARLAAGSSNGGTSCC